MPVAPEQALAEFRGVADEVISLQTPAWLDSIGQWYEDFTQKTDEQVVALLSGSRRGSERTGGGQQAVRRR